VHSSGEFIEHIPMIQRWTVRKPFYLGNFTARGICAHAGSRRKEFVFSSFRTAANFQNHLMGNQRKGARESVPSA